MQELTKQGSNRVEVKLDQSDKTKLYLYVSCPSGGA